MLARMDLATRGFAFLHALLDLSRNNRATAAVTHLKLTSDTRWSPQLLDTILCTDDSFKYENVELPR